MASYDNDPKFRDPYGPVDPADPAARPVDPALDARMRRDEYLDDTPRRRPSAAATILPILLLALVVGAAWWLMRTTPEERGMENQTAMGTPGYEAGPEAGIPGTVGTTGASTPSRGDGLVGVQAGDEVHLHDARITDIAGERTFWIEAGAGDRMLVIAPHTTGVSGQVGDRRETFRAGQTVAIEGRVEQSGNLEVEGLNAADRQALASAEGLVIRAMRVTGL
jgi:hypothetical protein